MEDILNEDDPNPNTNLQLTENFFFLSEYVVHIDTIKKVDKIVAGEPATTKACESYLNNINHFALPFHFLAHKESDLYCSHAIMLRTKLTHTHTYKY